MNNKVIHTNILDVASEYAVIAFLVDLCEGASCTDPVLRSVFQAVTDIRVPGEAVMTGPLCFTELIAKFHHNEVWR